MSITPPRQSGKSVAQALLTATKRGVLIVNNRTQFERFRRHGVPADQMRIVEELPKS